MEKDTGQDANDEYLINFLQKEMIGLSTGSENDQLEC